MTLAFSLSIPAATPLKLDSHSSFLSCSHNSDLFPNPSLIVICEPPPYSNPLFEKLKPNSSIPHYLLLTSLILYSNKHTDYFLIGNFSPIKSLFVHKKTIPAINAANTSAKGYARNTPQ